MTLLNLTLLLYYLNHAVDSGEHDDITIGEVTDATERREIFPYLKRKLGRKLDLSLLSEADLKEINRCYNTALETIDYERKMGVSRRGLCLVIAWTIELIQQQVGDVRADFSNWGGD